MRYLLLIILLLSFKSHTSAQKRVIYDSSSINVRTFSAQEIDAFRHDRRFQYYNSGGTDESWIGRIWAWILERWASLFTNKTTSVVVGWTIISLAVLVLVFFILKLMGITGTGLFGKKNRETKLNYRVVEENIHTLDFEDAIRQAVENSNFRLAVRLLYLQALKKLADKGLINWQINKTNVAYVRELQGTNYQQYFDRLTFQFENNWYGDVPIDEKEFMNVSDQFNQFNKQLK